MKHNCRVARRVYASTYANMAEQFKMYLNSLPPDKIDEIENDFMANGNGLLSVRQIESATELFHSFAMFYYINGRLPCRIDIFLFLMVKVLLELLEINEALRSILQHFSGQVQTALFHLHFLLPCCCFLPENFLTELYKNLTVEVLSSDNSENLQFDAFTDLCVKLGVRLENSIFANHERARLDMKKNRQNK